ncbi:MAG: helix-turn-helix domain-containing protein [Armatimonadetes bacterium]|nr:helix-turn-helix domain-containing protein [Armatimonadota bacterium]
MISEYELDKVMPSTEVIRKLADFFGVTTDYLIYSHKEDAAVRDRELLNYLAAIEEMPKDDQYLVKRFLRAFVVDHRLQNIPPSPQIQDEAQRQIVSQGNIVALKKRGRPGKIKEAVGV